MLWATPNSLFSWDFTVFCDSEFLADIDMSWLRERADVTIGDQAFSVCRTSVMSGTFVLKSGDQVLAEAKKVSAFTRTFEIRTDDRELTLKAVSIWKRQFALYENGAQIGQIGPTNWLRRRAVIDLPDDIPIPIQVFLFWLVVVLWRRQASENSS